MAAFPTTVATDSDLYIAVNATSTQLTDNPLTSGATTVNVTSTAAFPTVGFISIDNEIIKYTGKTATSFTGCTRGADGTAATSHVQNSQVFHNVIAAHHNALKDDLIATQQLVSDLIGRVNTQIRAPAGSVGSPSISFSGDTNTGVYSSGVDEISFTTNGVSRLRIDNAAIAPIGAGVLDFGTVSNFPAHSYIGDGTIALPSITFAGDTDTGLYRNTTNWFALVTGGTVALNVRSDQRLHAQDGSATFPIYAFINDEDCGLYRLGSNNIALGVNGARALEIVSSGAVKTKGTTTNDNATTGDVGEYVESLSVGDVNAAASGTYDDLTSISLTAGDWDVFVGMDVNKGTATWSDVSLGVSTTPGDSAAGLTSGNTRVTNAFAGSATTPVTFTLVLSPVRFSLSATTTIYMKRLFTYSAGTPKTQGTARISARRIR